MDEATSILNLVIANGETIILVIVGVCTLINQFMPKVISNEKLAKIEAITSKFSVGSKKAEIRKK